MDNLNEGEKYYDSVKRAALVNSYFAIIRNIGLKQNVAEIEEKLENTNSD